MTLWLKSYITYLQCQHNLTQNATQLCILPDLNHMTSRSVDRLKEMLSKSSTKRRKSEDVVGVKKFTLYYLLRFIFFSFYCTRSVKKSYCINQCKSKNLPLIQLEFAVSAFALHKKTKCSEDLCLFSCCPQRHLD